MAPVVIGALQFTSAAITCALIYEGSNTYSQVVAGYGNVIRVSPCLVIPNPKRGSPPFTFPPITLPISTPGDPSDPDWPKKKFDRCTELDQDVESIKRRIRAIGGACRQGMSAAELALRASLWAEEIAARELLIAECYQNDPDPGHINALKQAKDALKDCEEIPPAP